MAFIKQSTEKRLNGERSDGKRIGLTSLPPSISPTHPPAEFSKSRPTMIGALKRTASAIESDDRLSNVFT